MMGSACPLSCAGFVALAVAQSITTRQDVLFGSSVDEFQRIMIMPWRAAISLRASWARLDPRPRAEDSPIRWMIGERVLYQGFPADVRGPYTNFAGITYTNRGNLFSPWTSEGVELDDGRP